MRTFNYLAKTTILSLAAMSWFACAANDGGGENGKVPDDKKQQKIADYFSGYLEGNTSLYDGKGPLCLSEIEAARAAVWEAWKKANIACQEEKLIELGPLSQGNSGRWNLPAKLEPNAVMPYYWGSKGETIPEGGFPLYIYTHGSGPKDREWANGLALCNGFDDAPSVYFIPQIPNEGNYYRWWQVAKQYAYEKLLRQAFVSGNIDPDRVYVFGISEGGYGSQRLASFYADYLAAAGPMAGGEPLKNAPAENCRNIAFSLRTGALDNGFYRNKLTAYTNDEFDRLEKENPGSFIHHVELIPGMGHGIDYRPTTPWMKQYSRNPYPKTVSWENFEMDGRYRSGFYNLYVLERSNDDTDSRTYYEMRVDGNRIDLNVRLVSYKAVEIDPQWGIELKFEKTYQPVTKGKLLVYLCPELVDLSQDITLTVNGKEVFKGKVQPELKHIVNSCAAFFDPARLYPAAIEVDLGGL